MKKTTTKQKQLRPPSAAGGRNFLWKLRCRRAAMGQDEMKKKNEKQNPEKKIEHFFILHAKNPVFFPPYSEKRK